MHRTRAVKAVAPRASGARARGTPAWIPLSIALVTLLAMGPSLQNGFTNWDDPEYVLENPLVRDLSPSGLRAIATSFLDGNYHPLTVLSLALDYRFSGLDPSGYHRTNVAIHVLAALAVFWLVLVLTGSWELSAFVALFHGVHPMHVESVAWVTARKDLLYGLFYFLACASYAIWLRGERRKFLAVAMTVLFFVGSLLSKGMAVTLPLALLAIDFHLGRKWSWKVQVVEKAPFFVLALAFGILAVVAQRAEGAVQEIARFPLHERLLFAAHGLVNYAVRAVVPVHLSAFHPYPVKEGGFLPVGYYLAPLALALLAALVVRSLRRGRTIAFGALFFAINLVLVLQLIPVGSAAVAERYTYVPYVGIGLALGGAALALRGRGEGRAPAARTAARILLAGFVIVLVVLARDRARVWHDSVALWTDVVERYPTLPTAHTHRAWGLQEQGNLEGALADLDRALALDPENEEALSTRGTVHLMRQDFGRARADLDRALRLRPESSAAWNNRGLVRLNQGDTSGAVEDFTRAIELSPRSHEGYLNRAVALGGMKRYPEALSDIDLAVGLMPDNARAHLLRGVTRYEMGDAAGALEAIDTAIRLHPQAAEAYAARAQALERLGRFTEALQDAERARAGGHPLQEEYLETLRRAAATR
ncbi:MAG TPA: tetratricopeptide repeat protein [Candidatus Eisenbacteria bacterium]|nr:tetratricopeptide repeat protein [Candidatus Eisenbacteria bacterium]